MSVSDRPADPGPLVREIASNRAFYLSVARRLVKSADAAEDVVQDACLRACHAAAKCPDCPTGYACRMVRNLCLDLLRGNVARRGLSEDLGHLQPSVEAGDAVARLESREALARARGALERLPERTRSIFLRHRIGGVPQSRLARDLSLSPARVHALIQSADRACRAALSDATPATSLPKKDTE